MKDLIEKMLEVKGVIKLLIILTTLYTFSVSGQTSELNNLNDLDYKIINDLYSLDSKNKLFYTTIFDRSWFLFFTDDNMNFFNKFRGLGSVIEFSELENLLTVENRSRIIRKIKDSKPIEWNRSKLNNVKLVKGLKDKIFQETIFLSKPVVINNNLAIVRKISYNFSVIHFLQKKNDKWEVIYNVWDHEVYVD